MIFNAMTTKVALGAVVTRVPAITALDQDPVEVIKTGDWVHLDADAGTVTVKRAAE
jgi:predicted aconitase with swiveling domain